MGNTWSPSTFEEACKRNAGRRHYNAVRQFRAAFRQKQVIELLGMYGMSDHGVYARIARELGVSRSTITRDVQALLHSVNACCPRCGSMVPRERLNRNGWISD